VTSRFSKFGQARNIIPEPDYKNFSPVLSKPCTKSLDLRTLACAINTREAYEFGLIVLSE
jgi:hypothetical protein